MPSGEASRDELVTVKRQHHRTKLMSALMHGQRRVHHGGRCDDDLRALGVDDVLNGIAGLAA